MSVTPPKAGEIHLLCVDLDREDAGSEVLSPDELARAARFHFERDRRRWTAGRSLLRRVLAGYLETAPELLQFGVGRWGKPSLPDCPLRFNVSHSEEMALLAFAWQQEVGVDIEKSRLDVEPEALALQVFSAEEQAALRLCPPEKRLPLFLTLWTAKEAYVKAVGKGLSFPLSQLSLTLSPGSDRFQVEDQTYDNTRPPIFVCRIIAGPDCFAAAALEGPISFIRYLDIRNYCHASTDQHHHPGIQCRNLSFLDA